MFLLEKSKTKQLKQNDFGSRKKVRQLRIKKVMKKEVQEELVEMIIRYAEENSLTALNIREVTEEALKYFENNATISKP